MYESLNIMMNDNIFSLVRKSGDDIILHRDTNIKNQPYFKFIQPFFHVLF